MMDIDDIMNDGSDFTIDADLLEGISYLLITFFLNSST